MPPARDAPAVAGTMTSIPSHPRVGPAPTPSPASTPSEAPNPELRPTAQGDQQHERSGWAVGGLIAAGVAPPLKNVLLDRTRILAARSHAFALPDAGKHWYEQPKGKWAVELLLGAPTNDIVPITGGTVQLPKILGGRTIHDAWARSYSISNAAKLGLVAATGLAVGTNVADGLSTHGGGELLENKSGRTGILAAVAGALDVGIIAVALRRAGPGSGRLMRSLQEPLHSSTPMAVATAAISVPIIANELGAFSFLDTPSTRTRSLGGDGR
ncbi:MAG: hypothetical protein JWM25_392 [Thermoleophilia bacterium]|nr:hypothetical protein [Thermoleophilia bacterium]